MERYVMKPWTKSKYRRKLIKYLPAIIIAIWLFNLFLLFLIARNLLFLNSPVVNKPILVVAKLSTPTPTPTDEQMIKTLPHGNLVWQTYGHESTWGKNDPCRNKGLYNGFGWGAPDYPCYASLKIIATKVSNWFETNLRHKTVKQALCYYQTGNPYMENCDYAEYTLKIEVKSDNISSNTEVINLINTQRITPMEENILLDKSAKIKACDMVTKNYWAHNTPDGTTPWVFIKATGYDYIYAGENLARGFNINENKELVNAWMVSPGHRKNMLSTNYKDIGIGRCGNITVAHFGAR